MRNVLPILLITIALVASAPARAVGPGDQGPPWDGKDLLTGETLSFPAVLKGEPAVMLFWATWCPYCKAFMPYAKALQSEFGDQGVQFVTLNTKERGRGDPGAYARSLDFPLIAIGEADAIGEAWGIDFIPGLLVVNGSGEVIYRRRSTNLPAGRTVAQQWHAEVREVLLQLLAAAPAAAQGASAR